MQPIISPQTAATLTATQAVSTLAPVDVTVSSTPPNVSQLLRQIQISGTVTSPPDNGTVTLATALGNFTFSLSQLPQAAQQQLVQTLDSLFQSQKTVTATIQPGSPPTQAVLLLPTSTPALPANAANALTPFPQPLTLTAGTSLPAVVLPSDIVVSSAASGQQAAAAAAANPQSANNNPSVPTPALALQPADSSSEAAITDPLQPNLAPSAVPTAPVLQPGKAVMVQVDAVALPSAALPEATGDQISATVVGNGSNGQLIVKTSTDATLYIRSSVEAPIGTSMLIKVDVPKTPTPTVLQQVDSQNFAVLQQTLDAVAQISPQLAQQIIESRVPQPNAQLTGPLLFFLSALKQGDVKGWLGNDISEALTKAGKLELIARLGHAISSSGETQHDSTVGEWKSYPVPLHNNGQFQTLTLHVHRDGREASKDAVGNPSKSQVRFLIDVRMSRLGPIQLDGLVRPQKLDMIVRSETALPAGLPQELRSSYISTIEAFGYTGGLSFQAGRQHWLTPHKDSPPPVLT